MPRPSFYNDNEYRTYPFVQNATSAQLPTTAIVDAGVVMRLDAKFNETAHSVWLHSVVRSGTTFTFTLKTNAVFPTLVFTRQLNDEEWAVEYVDSASLDECGSATGNPDPAWTGFLVTGRLADLDAAMTTLATNTLTFAPTAYQLEPARIQNLARGYLRTLNVGNYRRVYVPNCCDNGTDAVTPILQPDIAGRDALTPTTGMLVLTTNNGRYWEYDGAEWQDVSFVVNARCLTGEIKIVQGYNCAVTQTTRLNEISISAAVGAGDQDTTELCQYGGELPLYAGELTPIVTPATETDPAQYSKFLSGGPACDELIFTVNGVGGGAITFAGGTGVSITTDTSPTRKITIERNISAAYGNSNQSGTP